MSVPKPIVLDFETEAIERRPQYPPKPAGVAIKWSAQKINKYYSWAHDSDNNCTKADAQKEMCIRDSSHVNSASPARTAFRRTPVVCRRGR